MLVSGLAAVTLVLLVPFALMMSVVYFDDNPRSEKHKTHANTLTPNELLLSRAELQC